MKITLKVKSARGGLTPTTFPKWRLRGRVCREHELIRQTWGWHSAWHCGLRKRDPQANRTAERGLRSQRRTPHERWRPGSGWEGQHTAVPSPHL